jgi:antitoxin (DNA-binding transcriptional repressor) of toxin-antitoxin stability system
MRSIGLFEAKTHFSEICDEVAQSSEPRLVLKRGKPHVRIEPIATKALGVWSARDAYDAKHGKTKADLLLSARGRQQWRDPLDA